MSLFGTMTTAVGGLDAQQEAISNISDNIANAQTVGFKRIDTSFENLVTESTQQLNEPGGVVAQPVYENNLAGHLVSSQQSTSLAITGSGFFQVKAPPPGGVQAGITPSFSVQDLYTRRGDFNVDANGYVVNGAGYYLEGLPIPPGQTTSQAAQPVPIQVTQLIDAPHATQNVTLQSNLPSSYPAASANAAVATPPPQFTNSFTYAAGTSAPPPQVIQIYDATGATHNATIQFDRVGANTWDMRVTVAGSTNIAGPPGTLDTSGNGGAAQATFQLTFGDGVTKYGPAGNQFTPAAGTLAQISDITANPAVSPVSNIATNTSANPATITLGAIFPGTGGASVTQNLTFNLGSYGGATGVTQFDDTQVTASTPVQDGIPRGSFKNLTIDSAGFVNLNYDNNQSVRAYQIPLYTFNSPDNLQRLEGGAFASTPQSGVANKALAGQNDAGTIDPSELEQSNVDIGTEFTQLITAQRVYSSNASVISTVNQMLQTVLGLIQA